MRYVNSRLSSLQAESTINRWKMGEFDARTITRFMHLSHAVSVIRGWWKNGNGKDDRRNVGEAFALMHSELSEALEGARCDAMSDKLPGFSALEEELADTLHRIFDFAAGADLRLAEAFEAKAHYNLTRKDHSLEEREKAGGKDF